MSGKKRSRNVTDAERNILLELIQPQKAVIENIKVCTIVLLCVMLV